jgi:hypothetical protein
LNVDDECLIIILDNILYTNLSSVLNNLQKIKQELHVIFQWVARLDVEHMNQLFVMIMGA